MSHPKNSPPRNTIPKTVTATVAAFTDAVAMMDDDDTLIAEDTANIIEAATSTRTEPSMSFFLFALAIISPGFMYFISMLTSLV